MTDNDLPTPSPIPTPSNSPYSLSERINIATRPIHSQLNRLILARLPLALPPYTTNPSTYISGLLHIAPIYITFESLWQTILDAPHHPTSLGQTPAYDACDPESPLLDSTSLPFTPNTKVPSLAHVSKVCSRTHSLLSHLQLPGLLRAGRLRADIRVLTETPEHRIDQQLEAIAQHGTLAQFIAHTNQSVETNPHVLLAYAWVLYMALFSGGRYLRASLQGAGTLGLDFWNRDPSPVRPYSVTQEGKQRRESRSEIIEPARLPVHSRSRSRNRSDSGVSKMVPGLQFFNFLGAEDGEDIKLEFKKRITEAEVLLTPEEKEDIISEAEKIFKFMVLIVGDLDAVMGTCEDDIETARLLQKSPSLMTSRNSVAVAQERLARKTRTLSDKLEQPRPKASCLEGLIADPVAKLVDFADALPALDVRGKTLSKRLSKDGMAPHVSFGSAIELKPPRSRSPVPLTVVAIFVPILAIVVGVLAGFYVG